MKTLIKRITIITIIILILSGLSFAGDFPNTTTTTPSGRTATTGIIDYPVQGNTTRRGTRSVVAAMPEQPVRREGESDEAYQARLRAWESVARKITATQSEAERLKQVLDSLKGSYGAGTYGVPFVGAATVSDTSLVIPTEEMKTEDILAINEDMNVMSQIVNNELIKTGLIVPLSFGSGYGGGYGGAYGSGYGSAINTGLAGNNIKSMYLQGYGALFLTNVDFPLSASPETQEQPEEPDKEEVDEVWEQTKQQIYEPQVVSTTTTNTKGPNVKYDAQKIENLKTTLITALKHATNIRAMKSDDAVILRISEISTSRSSIEAILGDQYFIRTGNSGKWVKKENLPENIKPLQQNVIIIRAKKSDIDAFAKGELDFDKFREKVKTFSYPLLSGNSETIR